MGSTREVKNATEAGVDATAALAVGTLVGAGVGVGACAATRFFFGRWHHTEHRTKTGGHVLGQKAFAVSELAALIAGPRHETNRRKKRCAIELGVPSA